MSVTDRRASLRAKLTDAAEAQIAQDGLASLRARDLAKTAGCSVGAIYTVFEDLQAVALAVNMRTFSTMGGQIMAEVRKVEGAPPPERMIAMAQAYLSYALAHPRRWKALFEVEMSQDSDIPETYAKALGQLFGLISGPLRELAPGQSAARIEMLTRAMFSSIHGMVLLGVEKRVSAVPQPDLPDAIAFIIRSGCDATS